MLSFPFFRPNKGAFLDSATNGNISNVKQYLDNGGYVDSQDDTLGCTALINASYGGHKAVCELLFARGCNVDIQDNNGDTAFIKASQFGHKAVCELLIARGCKVDMQNNIGHTALILASTNGHKAVCELLTTRECNVCLWDNNGDTALTFASTNGHMAVCELLITRGCNVDKQNNNGSTALMRASQNGHRQVCELLITGSKVDMQNKDGNTALIFASDKGHKAVCELLITRGSKVDMQNNNGYTALIFASTNGHKEVCELLITRRCNVDMQNENGDTALILASSNGKIPVVISLIRARCDQSLRNKKGKSAMDYLREKHPGKVKEVQVPAPRAFIDAALKGNISCVKEHLTRRVHVDSQNEDGNTALILASSNGHKAVCELLITCGCNLDMQDKDGWTALIRASLNGKKAVCELLITRGSKVDMQNKDGNTALICASLNGHEAVCELLTARGCNVHMQNERGWTALTLASFYGHEAVCELLITRGCNVGMQNKDGDTASILASKNGHIPIVISLIEAGCDYSLRNKKGKSAMDYLREEHPSKVKEVQAAIDAMSKNKEEAAALLQKKNKEEEAAAALLQRKKQEVDWPRLVNDNREDIDDIKSLLSRIGFSRGESQKYAEVLVINHELNTEMKFQVAMASNSQHYYTQLQLPAISIQLIDRYLVTSSGKLDSLSQALPARRRSSGGGNETGKEFTFDGITITDAQSMSELRSDTHDPVFDGMYFGSFSKFNKKYEVVIKESIRLRDITHEASLFRYFDDAKSGCIDMYGFNKDASPPFIVLERFGCDLQAKMFRNRSMQPELKRVILRGLLEAVAALHGLDVMHGDIKPRNVLVDSDCNVKLCDLDSARIVTAKNSFFPYDVDTKELKFSSPWASPEVYDNNLRKAGGVFKASFAIDVFSVGLIAALLEDKYNNVHSDGVVLPRQDSQDYRRALTDESFLHSSVLKVDGAYRDIILGMCHLDPALRPTSAYALATLSKITLTNFGQAIEQAERHSHFLEDTVVSNLDKVVSKLDSITDMLHQFSDKMTDLVTSNKDVEALLHQVSNQVAYMSKSQSQEMTKLQADIQQANSTLHTYPPSSHSVILEKITAMNNKLNTILQDTWKIPTLAVVLKKNKSRMPSWLRTSDDYALYFLCEHTLELVPCGPSGEGFEFKQLRTVYADAFKKMAPILMVGLTMLKIAVTLYGIPIPLPDLSSLSNGDITSMLNDMMLHLDVNGVDARIQAIASSENPLDVINQAMVTTEQQREAYKFLLKFLNKAEYKPHKFGLVKETTKSGITKWIKDDQAVITSFHDHDGRPRRKI